MRFCMCARSAPVAGPPGRHPAPVQRVRGLRPGRRLDLLRPERAPRAAPAAAVRYRVRVRARASARTVFDLNALHVRPQPPHRAAAQRARARGRRARSPLGPAHVQPLMHRRAAEGGRQGAILHAPVRRALSAHPHPRRTSTAMSPSRSWRRTSTAPMRCCRCPTRRSWPRCVLPALLACACLPRFVRLAWCAQYRSDTVGTRQC